MRIHGTKKSRGNTIPGMDELVPERSLVNERKTYVDIGEETEASQSLISIGSTDLDHLTLRPAAPPRALRAFGSFEAAGKEVSDLRPFLEAVSGLW